MRITVITDDKTGKIVGTARADSGSSTPGTGAGSPVAGPGQSVRELNLDHIRDIENVADLHAELLLGHFRRQACDARAHQHPALASRTASHPS